MKFLATTFLLLLTAITAFTQATKPKPKPAATKPIAAASKSKPATTASKKPDEKAEWEKASTNPDGPARIAALRKFVKTFPKSAKAGDAAVLIVTAEVGLGNDKLSAGDAPGANVLYIAAANEAPTPIPDALFTETLSKIPANLYFRGARDEGIAIAKILEVKAEASADQLLSLASFYMSVENGSEAKRVADAAIKLTPGSSVAYQTLGLASRMEFQLEDSAAAYAKALELDPESLSARRGLAEMKRSLGRSDEAAALYREILAKDDANLPAQTGLILSLFDAGSRADAESALANALEANPGNVILLAGAAYWYAAHEEGDRAVALSQKAIAADPRFIWSHIALARGLMSKKDPVGAEKVLLAARRYGNFPTLEYEIASARVAAGYYREASEELKKSFKIQDGVIHANLGGRLPRESKNFTELVGYERRASIFAPTAADSPENAAKLTALLTFKQELDSAEPKAETAAAAADEFIKGDDKMKVHRQIFAASQLLDKKVALSKVVEISRYATSFVDAGLDVPNASVAVMADELYENRSIAAARGEYINVPAVPRATLSAILRGQIEELNGWANYQLDATNEAVIRLKRAMSVLPVDSAWWRTSTWQLGTALMRAGKDAEALDIYIKSYKSSGPSLINYGVIENLYTKVNGSTGGLEAKIGAKPALFVSSEAVAQKTEAVPEPKVEPTPPATPEIIVEATPTPVAIEAERPVDKPTPAPTIEATPEPTPVVKATEKAKAPEIPASVPVATPETAKTEIITEPMPTPTVKVEEKPVDISSVVPIATPEPSKPEPTIEIEPSPTPETVKEPVMAAATPSPTPENTPEEVKATPAAEASPSSTPEDVKATPTPEISPSPAATPGVTPAAQKAPEEKTGTVAKELFPPVIITIPPPETPKLMAKEPEVKAESTPASIEVKPAEMPAATPSPEPTPSATPEIKLAETQAPTPSPDPTPEIKPTETPAAPDGRPRLVDNKAEIKPCTLTVSEESITLQTGGGDLAVIVGLADYGELDGLTAISSSPQDVALRREVIAGVKARALFVVRAVSSKVGMYQIRFEMPCGKKDVLVRVK